MRLSTRRHPAPVSRSAFAGFRFPAEVITVAVRWYLRYGLSYRDVEELLAERGVEVDHVTVYRWVQRFTPLFADAARFARHAPGDRWFVDETYVKVGGVWRYVYRAVDQHGQVIDVLVSKRARRRCRPPVLPPRVDHAEGDAVRGGHRQGTGLPAGSRRAGPGGVAPRRAVRKQPDRSRSRPAQTPAATHARATNRPHRPSRSSPGSPSCRISAAATTNSPPKPHAGYASPLRSPNSPKRSDTRRNGVSACPPIRERNSATQFTRQNGGSLAGFLIKCSEEFVMSGGGAGFVVGRDDGLQAEAQQTGLAVDGSGGLILQTSVIRP